MRLNRHIFEFSFALIAVFWFAAAAARQAVPATKEITGFTASGTEMQHELESRLLAIPDSATFRNHLAALTREPHVAGTAANLRVAAYIAKTMAAAGFEVRRYDYDVYLPDAPGTAQAALISPVRLALPNREKPLGEDRFSGHRGLHPGWNAYSGSGDVRGQVVYANYGRKADFALLEEQGISVRDRIVLARYGGNFRGYKAKFAAEAGAAGLLMYSDPADGGASDGPPYPEGRYLNASTIQRGSVLALDYTGDPLTPFSPAYTRRSGRRVDRLKPADVALPDIPVMPLPHAAAREILERMEGPVAPDAWFGGLELPYRTTGGTELIVRMRVRQSRKLQRITNVVGYLRGAEEPNRMVVLGCHYDAWGFGAVDPNSGTAMLLTLAEALGRLNREGGEIRRSIAIAHWDAEEFGIIGSTEWVEQHRSQLTRQAVVYLNADAAVTGPNFGAAASPSLKQPIFDAAKRVDYPQARFSVYDHWRASRGSAQRVPISGLGGGSDHVAFYTFAGIPSAGISMSGAAPVYHSNYDTFAWYERFGDTGFVYGPALARVNGVLALRFANAALLPYDVSRYATDLASHVSNLETIAASRGVRADFQELSAEIGELGLSAARFENARLRALELGLPDERELAAVNDAMIGFEKAFLRQDGLPFSRWNQSLYAAPDPFSGYASWMLPGLRYWVETENVGALEKWQDIYVDAVRKLQTRIRAATQLLAGTSGVSR